MISNARHDGLVWCGSGCRFFLSIHTNGIFMFWRFLSFSSSFYLIKFTNAYTYTHTQSVCIVNIIRWQIHHAILHTMTIKQTAHKNIVISFHLNLIGNKKRTTKWIWVTLNIYKLNGRIFVSLSGLFACFYLLNTFVMISILGNSLWLFVFLI